MTTLHGCAQMDRNLARHVLQEVKQAVAADEMERAHSVQELKLSLMRDKSATEVGHCCSQRGC